MRLEALAALGPPQREARVPPWTFGCWRRRAITFANGATDGATRVFWLQSKGLTADLRLPARGRDTSSLTARLALEGGLAQTSWDGQKMAWSAWTSFQLHDKWPEPGLLTRVGDCLIEFAPSGIYVEDWRLQPSAPGLWAGLELIEERDLDKGAVRHRGGGLIVAGEHAALVKGRPAALPPAARLEQLAGAAQDDPALLDLIFAFEASYARLDGAGVYRVEASTAAAREGETLMALDGFSYDGQRNLVRQQTRENGVRIERLFAVDTLESDVSFPLVTAARAHAAQWLENEAATLLRDAAPLAPLAS